MIDAVHPEDVPVVTEGDRNTPTLGVISVVEDFPVILYDILCKKQQFHLFTFSPLHPLRVYSCFLCSKRVTEDDKLCVVFYKSAGGRGDEGGRAVTSNLS